MNKEVMAVRLCKEAQKLADVGGKNPIHMGVIAYEVKKDPELILLSGAKSYEDWMKTNFGKKRTTAYRWRLVVQKLLDKYATEDELFDMGAVKAYELARLPESQLEKGEWLTKAKTMDSAEFKHSVEAFIADRPDHLEARYWLHISMPESFRAVHDLAMAMAGGLAAKDGDSLETKPELVEYIFAGFVKAYQDEVDLEKLKVADSKQDEDA